MRRASMLTRNQNDLLWRISSFGKRNISAQIYICDWINCKRTKTCCSKSPPWVKLGVMRACWTRVEREKKIQGFVLLSLPIKDFVLKKHHILYVPSLVNCWPSFSAEKKRKLAANSLFSRKSGEPDKKMMMMSGLWALKTTMTWIMIKSKKA